MKTLLLIIPFIVTFSIVIGNLYLPISSNRSAEFMNYVNSLFSNYYEHNNFVQQYIDRPLVEPIQKSFNALALNDVNYQEAIKQLGPRPIQDDLATHYAVLTFYVQYGNQQRLPELLDLLGHYGVKNAVFFFEKRYMDDHEFVIKRIQYMGYLVKPWVNLSEYDRDYTPTNYRNLSLVQNDMLNSVTKDLVAKNFLLSALHYENSNIVAFTPAIMSHKIILEEVLKENGNGLTFIDSNKTEILNRLEQNQSNSFNSSHSFSDTNQLHKSTQPLVISTGIWTMESLQKKYPRAISHLSSNDEFLVSRPIFIDKGAELKISNSKVFLKISPDDEDRAIFIQIIGKGLLLNSTLTSWDPLIHSPSPDPYHPRPFLRVNDGGKMDILNSTVTHLGYSLGGTNDTRYARAAIEYRNTSNFVIANSKIAFNYYGFYSDHASDFKITGNDIYGQTGYGLDPHTGSRNFVVDSNHIHDNGNQGVICSIDCKNVTISNNFVDHNVEGIGLHWLTDSSIVRDNLVKYNLKYGIFIQKFSSHNIVENNTVTNNMRGIGLLQGSHNNIITNNTVTKNIVGGGIYESTDSKSNTINRNII